MDGPRCMQLLGMVEKMWHNSSLIEGQILKRQQAKDGLHYNVLLISHRDVVQLLLDRGADPNKTDKDGMTALHCAAFNGNKDVVQLLLDRGAEPNKA